MISRALCSSVSLRSFLKTSYKTIEGTISFFVSSIAFSKFFAFMLFAKYSSHADESIMFIFDLFHAL